MTTREQRKARFIKTVHREIEFIAKMSRDHVSDRRVDHLTINRENGNTIITMFCEWEEIVLDLHKGCAPILEHFLRKCSDRGVRFYQYRIQEKVQRSKRRNVWKLAD